MTWQPDGWNDDMSEAPQDGTRVWAYWPDIYGNNSAVQIETWYGHWGKNNSMMTWQNVWEWADGANAPTHWRHLPSPPSKQED